jgi:outer membrane protein assembly factor BamA
MRVLATSFLLLCLTILGTPNLVLKAKTAEVDSVKNTAATDGDAIRAVVFNGNYNVNSTTLEGLINTKTNRELFEIPRLTVRYFLWKFNPKWGESPKRLDRAIVSRDMELIQLYYRSFGFFDTKIDTSLISIGRNKAKVLFKIDEGKPAFIDSVFFRGIPNRLIVENDLKNFLNRSPLKAAINSDTSIVSKRQYKEELIELEHTRLINFLKRNGYASIKQDSVVVLVKKQEQNPNKLDLLFDVKAGNVHKFGDLSIQLNEPDQSSLRQERIFRDSTVTIPPKVLKIEKNDENQTKFNTLQKQILYKPGDIYNQSLFDLSLTRLQRLGMLGVLGHGTGLADQAHNFDSLYVPMYINLQSIPKHQISTEWFGLRRFGFGTGSNITYSNNNVFGGAERFQLSFNGSIEFLTDNSITRLRGITDSLSTSLVESRALQSYETSLSYSIPTLGFPFNNIGWNTNSLNTKTEYAITHSTANQIFYDINLELRLSWRFEVQHSVSKTSFIDLLELEWLDTDPQQAYLDQLERIYQDPVLVSFAREDFRPQFTSIFRYRYRNSTTDPIKRDKGFLREYSVAFAGNLPFLLDKYVVTPDKLESNLPSLFGISGNRIDYAQFIKVTADFRQYKPIDTENESVWANRLFVGLIHPYGKNTDIPINRRFFAGGNNDIRSYNVFRLGPGSLETQEIPRNGGEIKLMLQTEVRQRFISNLIAADWYSVIFAETGNVWYGFRDLGLPPEQSEITEAGRFRFNQFYKQLPVVGGYGLRLDWDFVVLRIDLAFRFRDLQTGWFQNSRPFFAFGIGHSF